MGVREILKFCKDRAYFFSLPFVLIGYVLAHSEFGSGSLDLLWILLAAVGARGLAMVLNRLLTVILMQKNPVLRPVICLLGKMSKQIAWGLGGPFPLTLAFSAWMLNEVALQMVWLPVLHS
ncbi:MAG: hypothetical protein CM1200mP21_02510 [Candidatus Poseidoniales archaeon]|nr:MAG: hypothetical protein CM1200mP21_02510 [Candidatus Poseidoniales archaeon]